MKITDTIGMVLKRKGNAKILSMRPEQSVFEALELMAQYDIGALLVLTGENLVGIFQSGTMRASARCSGTSRGRRW